MIGTSWMDVPGIGSTYETQANEFRWGKGGGIEYGANYLVSTARDSTNTPTTFLRAGLVLGMVAATGKLTAYGANNTDGSNVAVGILTKDLSILDGAGTAVDKWTDMMVAGPVRPSALFGFDENARAQLAGRFLFDDRGYSSTSGDYTRTVAKPAGYTAVAADNGTTFTTTGAAGAVTFILPAAAKGLRFRFFNTVNQNMIVQAPAGKLIGTNGAAYTTLTFSTTNEKIGAAVEMVADDTGGFWLAILLSNNTATFA